MLQYLLCFLIDSSLTCEETLIIKVTFSTFRMVPGSLSVSLEPSAAADSDLLLTVKGCNNYKGKERTRTALSGEVSASLAPSKSSYMAKATQILFDLIITVVALERVNDVGSRISAFLFLALKELQWTCLVIASDVYYA